MTALLAELSVPLSLHANQISRRRACTCMWRLASMDAPSSAGSSLMVHDPPKGSLEGVGLNPRYTLCIACRR